MHVLSAPVAIVENTLSLLHSQSLSVTSYRPYAIPHVTKRKNGQWTEIWILRQHFESQGRQWSMEQSTVKHFASSLRQWGVQVSLFALVSVRSCWELVHSGCKCKITSWVGEKEACKLLCCSYLSSIDHGHNGGVVSIFLSTIRFTFGYMRWWHHLHKVYISVLWE